MSRNKEGREWEEIARELDYFRKQISEQHPQSVVHKTARSERTAKLIAGWRSEAEWRFAHPREFSTRAHNQSSIAVAFTLESCADLLEEVL